MIAASVATSDRQLPEDVHPYMERDMKIGAAAGHALILRVHNQLYDYGICSCGKWRSINFYDDMSGPYLPWKQHVRHKGVVFGKKREKPKGPQH
jgi:hypothetical protein